MTLECTYCGIDTKLKGKQKDWLNKKCPACGVGLITEEKIKK